MTKDLFIRNINKYEDGENTFMQIYLEVKQAAQTTMKQDLKNFLKAITAV